MNTAITFDPEIVAGPMKDEIEAILKPYKFSWVKPTNPFV